VLKNKKNKNNEKYTRVGYGKLIPYFHQPNGCHEKQSGTASQIKILTEKTRGAGKSIIGGQIFIYSCSQTVKTIAFKGNK
jgi:hypothetical protein